MHNHMLTQNQFMLAQKILPELKEFYLCGGTAIALQIGHRKSLDLDLASQNSVYPQTLTKTILKLGLQIEHTMVATADELSIVVNGVKLTFFNFPFPISAANFWPEGQIQMPDLLNLGSMKAYALGRRSKWKDYVDLYFMLKYHFDLDTLIKKSESIFQGVFNSKLFREQLCYFEDIDMTEEVEYVSKPPDRTDIYRFLTDIAIS